VLYWVLKYVVLGPLLRLLYRPRIEGVENLPKQGAAILASNHLAVADSIFLPLLTPRRITFLAKREYFTERGIKGWAKRMFFGGTGNVPIDRSSGSAAQAALDTGVRLLTEGKLLGIYPEGTRSPDGRLYKGKTGIARMALEARVPVIPVAMIGTDEINVIGSSWSCGSAARLISPAMTAWSATALSSVRWPTRSCTRSWSSPARCMSTSMRPRPRRTRPRPRRMAGRRPGCPRPEPASQRELAFAQPDARL
jgi:1-acyl-sn-glycerol-3-phosphate acyltransferase